MITMNNLIPSRTIAPNPLYVVTGQTTSHDDGAAVKESRTIGHPRTHNDEDEHSELHAGENSTSGQPASIAEQPTSVRQQHLRAADAQAAVRTGASPEERGFCFTFHHQC